MTHCFLQDFEQVLVLFTYEVWDVDITPLVFPCCGSVEALEMLEMILLRGLIFLLQRLTFHVTLGGAFQSIFS